MAYEGSNGHVIDDATWARKVKSWPIHLQPNILKTATIA